MRQPGTALLLPALRPLLAFLALLPMLTETADAQRRRGGRGGNRDFENLTYESKRFKSKSLKRTWDYGIFLPKEYAKDKNKTYPWIIHLHGMREDHNRFSWRGCGNVLDEMVGKKDLPELIIVCAEGTRTSFYMNGKFSLRYEDMVVKDLVAHIEKTYRVKKERRSRALLGWSAGGGGALRIALAHPQVFGVVATHSAAILPKNPDDLEKEFPWIATRSTSALVVMMYGNPIDKKLWRKSNPLWLAEKIKLEKLDGLKIYFDCGTRDRYGFHRPNVEFHKVLKRRHIKHTWRSVEGGSHGSRYNADNLPHSLMFIAAAWAQKRGVQSLGGLLGGKQGAAKGPDSRPSKPAGKDIK